MTTAGEVVSEVRVDDQDFDRKMRGIDRRLEKTEQDAKRGAKRRGSVLAAGVAGAVAGAAAGAATQNTAVSGLIDMLLNIVAAVVAPVLIASLPLLEAITPALIDLSNSLAGPLGTLAEQTAAILNVIGRSAEGGVFADVTRPRQGESQEEFQDRVTDSNGQYTGPVPIFPWEKGEGLVPDRWEDAASSAWEDLQEGFAGVGGWFS